MTNRLVNYTHTHTHTHIYICVCVCVCVYRVSQEERSIFWEVIVSVILSKNICINTCPIPVSEVELFECTTGKLLIRKRYYVYEIGRAHV